MASVLIASAFLNYFMCTLLFVTALFLTLLVLVQRGRGGGLTGALGGMGGQSAFGTKAGDMFTRVTMITAGVWIVLCMFTIKLFSSQDPWAGATGGKVKVTAPAQPGKEGEAEASDQDQTDATAPGAAEPKSAGTADKSAPAAEKTPDAAAPAAAEKTAEQPAAPAKE